MLSALFGLLLTTQFSGIFRISIRGRDKRRVRCGGGAGNKSFICPPK